MRPRGLSFHDIDEAEASGILGHVVKESKMFLGGSSIGKGLKRAAIHYMKHHRTVDDAENAEASYLNLPGAKHLNHTSLPLEDSFYVIDMGVVVSQVYQWKRFFPRVEPFYAVKCNPDPVIVKTLAILGCHFDCASHNEIRLVEQVTKDLPRKPEIIFANPCKSRAHIMEAVCKGVTHMTFDNIAEVQKCASISNKIQLVMRIITDDRGSRCRFSSKFGAPQYKWRPMLAEAKRHGLDVVGVSFHVGSGCRDASRYELALKDARMIFDMAKKEFGMNMHLLDIGGGFPGETYSIWNPSAELDEDQDQDSDEGKRVENEDDERFMFFTEIAEQVAPVIDELFPPDSGVRIIAEPGRYFVAAAASLCCTITSCRNNRLADHVEVEVNDQELSQQMNDMTRRAERELIQSRGKSLENAEFLDQLQEELKDYSKLYANQQLVQQEVDVYNDGLDLYKEDYETAIDLLGPPDDFQRKKSHHTVEGMAVSLVAETDGLESTAQGLTTLASAGEAAVNGLVLQACVDSAPLQDDFSYYINDGVYGAFNNIMFDHAVCRPRVLRAFDNEDIPGESDLYASTVFGPTCDSIDVISRSVLLPKLQVGDWLYFENMGAYTSAAASTFNGFEPSRKFYVCSVMPEYFEQIIAGPAKRDDEEEDDDEEKKAMS